MRKLASPGTFLYAHTHPAGGLPNYYRENVIGGPGAFVLQIVNFDTFAEAMTNKLLTEISDASRKCYTLIFLRSINSLTMNDEDASIS